MRIFLKQDARRVRRVIPEPPCESDTVVGSIVLDHVVAGRQQVYTDVAAVRGVVSSDAHPLASHQVDTVEVVDRHVAFNETVRDAQIGRAHV